MAENDRAVKVISYHPGECVFLQGKVLGEFYSIRRGRFAVVKNKPGKQTEPSGVCAGDGREILVFNQMDQTVGEIDALLGNPQSISVVALDSGELSAVPVFPPQKLDSALTQAPTVSLKVCVSFARKLKSLIDTFVELLDLETALDHLIQNSCRAYLAIVHEVRTLAHPGSGRNAFQSALDFALSHPLFAMAKEAEKTPLPERKTGSINNCIIRPPAGSEKVMHFPAGTCICRRGTPGNRMFILHEGTVDVVLNQETRIQIREIGTTLGEIAVLLNLEKRTPEIRRTADVICMTPVKALVLGLEEVEDYVLQHSEVGAALVKALVERTRHTNSSTLEARERLRHKLFSALRQCLEGHHQLARNLEPHSQDLRVKHPFNSAVQQSRKIFDRFAALKENLGF